MDYFKMQNKEIIKETNTLFKTYNGLKVIFPNRKEDEDFFNKLYIGQDIGIFDTHLLHNTLGKIVSYDALPNESLIKSLYNNVTVISKKNRLHYYNDEKIYFGNCVYDIINDRGEILKNIVEKDISFNESEKNVLIKKCLDKTKHYIYSSLFSVSCKGKLIKFINQVEDFYKIK